MFLSLCTKAEGPNGRKWHTTVQVKNKTIMLGGEATNKQFMRDVLVLDLGKETSSIEILICFLFFFFLFSFFLPHTKLKGFCFRSMKQSETMTWTKSQVTLPEPVAGHSAVVVAGEGDSPSYVYYYGGISRQGVYYGAVYRIITGMMGSLSSKLHTNIPIGEEHKSNLFLQMGPATRLLWRRLMHSIKVLINRLLEQLDPTQERVRRGIS